MVEIVELRVADDPEVWAALGFDVVDGTCRVGTVDLVLTGAASGRGITGWTWAGAGPDDRPVSDAFGQIDTRFVHESSAIGAADPHPNTAIAMFYVVLFGPSHAAAVDAVSALGADVSEPIRMGGADQPARLRSLAPAGGIEVEVIGPADHDPDGKWRLWGVIIEVGDLDALAERLGERLRPVKPAVQPGRRIATLDKAAGSSVAIAFMSGIEA